MENTTELEGSMDSSGGSTPEPPVPFCPKFDVLFTDRITKDGDAIKYGVQVSQNGAIVQVIERFYEDFEYLEHCTITDQPFQGLIIPPLPYQEAVDAQSAEAYTKKNMGKTSKALLGDDFRKKSYELQKYLELLLAHPVLGKSPRLQEFLLNKDAPPIAKIRRGFMSVLCDTLDSRKMAYPDCDDFFQRERDWVAKYRSAAQDFSTNFNKVLYSQIKLSHQLEQMVVALRLCPTLIGVSKTSLDINKMFLRLVDILKTEMKEKICREELKVGCSLSLWWHFVVAEEAMLLRRVALMVDYQACNRALDKAKPNRKQAAEVAKKEAEEAFESCSDDARSEIKRFHKLRTSELLQTVNSYMHHQIAYTKKTISHLSSALASVRAISM